MPRAPDLSPLAADLRRMVRGEVRVGESLRRHTSLRIGGPADLFFLPRDEADAQTGLDFARRRGWPCYVLGAGTNLLVRDEGVRGLVVKTAPGLSWVRFEGAAVRAGGGFPLARLVRLAADRGLCGAEELAGIPGSVGGAVVMNAGAHGRAIADVLTGARVLFPDGRLEDVGPERLGLRYRGSALVDSGALVVEARLELAPGGDPVELRRRIREGLEQRRRSQPPEPSAGCVFRNPSPERPAGWLIEQAGCKGLREGGALVSATHANFIVNVGAASARDVLTLIERVRRAVSIRFGVDLELEIRVVGG
ncbi:MAG: UDP-N-acetylmuramate dehydrogenase [Acetobacteraceae bacterium]|nr:UDP-N-acetylmuramate dehydrogenase [Acetobacteraceae bacterium]